MVGKSKAQEPVSIGQEITSFVEGLRKCGYKRRTIQTYERYVNAFGCWLDRKNITLKRVSANTIEEYAESCLLSFGNSYRDSARHAIRMLLDNVRGSAEDFEEDAPSFTANQLLLSQYAEHLDSVMGLVAGSRKQYILYAGRFLSHQGSGTGVDWSRISAESIAEFVKHEVAPRKGFGPHRVTTATRSFLRFLVAQGLLKSGMENSIPVMKTYSQATLPKHFSTDEVERLLAACIDGTALGKRNHAILVLLARLGLRSNEVIRIQLEDIDWTNACLIVRASKPRTERKLPISQEIGESLTEYLLNGRPSTKHQEFFLSHIAPITPLQNSNAISHLVSNLLKKVGIEKRERCGAHRFRHTAATRLVNEGAFFKEVADFLGHQWLQTTAIYAKLNLSALSAIALPWSGDEQ